MKMQFKKILAIVLALTMAFALLTACSSGTDTETKTDTDTKTEDKKDTSGNKSDEEKEANKEAVDAAPEKASKDVITIMTQTSWNSFQSYIASNSGGYGGYWGASLLYYNSVDFHPMLCKSYEMADDYSSATLYLRDDVDFYGTGNHFTSEDVRYLYQFHLDNQCAYNALIWNYIESIDVIDDYTIKFNFKNTSPIMFEAWTIAVPDSKAWAADPEGYWEQPTSAGGWYIESSDIVSYTITLNVWEDSWFWDYYASGEGYRDVEGKMPNFKSLKFIYNSEEASRVSALRSGEADAAKYLSADQLNTLTNEGFEVAARDENGWTQLLFNNNVGKAFNDVNLRKAASCAIDRQAMVDSIIGGYGTAFTWPCRSTHMGYSDEVAYYYDPDEAKSLVDQYYDGRELDMLICISYVQSATEVSQAAQAFLQAVGFNVNLQILEAATYQPLMDNGAYDLLFNDLGGSVHENLKFYAEIWGTQDRFKMGTAAISPRMQELADLMFNEMDVEKETVMREEFMKLQAELYGPMIFLYTDTAFDANCKELINIDYRPSHNDVNMYMFAQYVG